MGETAARLQTEATRTRSKGRDRVEIAVAYSLILLVIWTPRPWQRYLWIIAALAIAIMVCTSFDNFRSMGLCLTNFFRSLWIVGVALLLAAAAFLIAAKLHTLRLPAGPLAFVATYCVYAIWSGVQQLLLQGFFLQRLLRVIPNATHAAVAASVLFATAHLPSAILTPMTLIWGLAACLLFLRYRNLYSLAFAHAILGITVAITIPGPVDHNMRVGLGYLTYRQHVRGHRQYPLVHPLPQP
jgi:Type II CAAX prenyl endopeptidase Rce1-like